MLAGLTPRRSRRAPPRRSSRWPSAAAGGARWCSCMRTCTGSTRSPRSADEPGPQPAGRGDPAAVHLPARLPGLLAGPLLCPADPAAAPHRERERRRGPRRAGRRRSPGGSPRWSSRGRGQPVLRRGACAGAARPPGRRPTRAPSPDASTTCLAARIDLPARATRGVLQTASVIGREFSPRLLQPLCGEGVVLDPHVAELKRLESSTSGPGPTGPSTSSPTPSPTRSPTRAFWSAGAAPCTRRSGRCSSASTPTASTRWSTASPATRGPSGATRRWST